MVALLGRGNFDPDDDTGVDKRMARSDVPNVCNEFWE